MSYRQKSVFACVPRPERGRAIVLNGDPKGKNMVYTNGHTVVIRDIANPSIAETYTQHSVDATVAQYAPSGFYIASADISGKIRIWDTTQQEHLLKYEYQPFSGPVKDLCWSPDSKRIAVCGEGREKFAAVILWDTGSNVGQLNGHSKAANSITYKPTRPFRIATASEDFTVCFYEGPPFKFKCSINDHSRFVNTVRYAPNGDVFCSGGSDGLAVLYDGKTSEKKAMLGGDKAHSGGIYAVSWSPDSHRILTASGDKTCKLWDAETTQMISEFKMGNAVDDQQLGCLWQGEWLLSVSLSGSINYLDKDNPSKPLRVLRGQNQNLNSIAVSKDSTTVYSGSVEGRVSHWNVKGSGMDLMNGPGHTNLVCSMATNADRLFSLGLDKNLKTASTSTNEYSPESFTLSDRDPTAVAVNDDGLSLVTTKTELFLVKDNKRLASLPIDYEALSVSFHPTNGQVAVGGKDSIVHIYNTDGDSITQQHQLTVSGEVTTVSYSPNGEKLAASGYAKTTHVFETSAYKEVLSYMCHTARVMCLAWSPNSQLLVSGSIDTNVGIYNTATKTSSSIKGAHPQSIVSGVVWITDTTFATCGHDCCIRIWEHTAA